MSRRCFYQTVSYLVQANALHTLTYLLDVAYQLEAEADALVQIHSRPLVLWPDECAVIFDIMTDPHVGRLVLNPDGIVLWANDEIASWLKRKPADMLGRCLWDISHSGDMDERKRLLTAALETGRMQTMLDSNSRHQPMQSVAVPMPVPGCPCALVICKALEYKRVFTEAFGKVRVIE